MNKVLVLLGEYTDAPFQKDYRSLLGTPRSTKVYEMDGGHYCHFSIKSILESFLSAYKEKGIDVECFKLKISVDGAPLAKSSEKGLWIILASETILDKVELIGIYYGPDKPKDSNELMKRCVEELKQLINEGIEFDKKIKSVILHALICDSPAKSYLLKVKMHSGYWSCTKCTIKRTYLNHVCFPGKAGKARNDKGFKNKKYIDDNLNDGHQLIDKLGTTILADIPKFGCVTNVVIDYMHLILLGVMLQLIVLWTLSRDICSNLSDADGWKISKRLKNVKQFTPSDFGRKLRSFEKAKRIWKAHELRQFLLYVGPVVLLGILDKKLYDHFLKLQVPTLILVNPVLVKNESYLDIAEILLQEFVEEFQELYSARNVSFNVHSLLHVVDEVRKFGPLDSFSAFPFENFIGKVKKMVKSGNKPLEQISNRIYEKKSINSSSKETDLVQLERLHDDGPLIDYYSKIFQYHVFKKGSL